MSSFDFGKHLIQLALEEDIGTGDYTSEYFVHEEQRMTARVVSRQVGVCSGIDLAKMVFQHVDSDLSILTLVSDGDDLIAGTALLEVKGSARSILTAERVALNFLQHLCGIASLTAKYVQALTGTKACILDTRKTLPAYRFLAKQAVLHGGGMNHRMGLYDRVMIKDNHLALRISANIQQQINLLKQERPHIEVEIEADNLDQVAVFLTLDHLDYILLDNMTCEDMQRAVAMRNASGKTIYLEASGGVNLDVVRSIAETGVDFISVGALTHSAPALDLGLDYEPC